MQDTRAVVATPHPPPTYPSACPLRSSTTVPARWAPRCAAAHRSPADRHSCGRPPAGVCRWSGWDEMCLVCEGSAWFERGAHPPTYPHPHHHFHHLPALTLLSLTYPLALTAGESVAEGMIWGKRSPKAPLGFSLSAYGRGGLPFAGSPCSWTSLHSREVVDGGHRGFRWRAKEHGSRSTPQAHKPKASASGSEGGHGMGMMVWMHVHVQVFRCIEQPSVLSICLHGFRQQS